MSISKKIMDSLGQIDESLADINEAIQFRWSGEGEKWTDKWVKLVQEQNPDLVGKFKKELSVKIDGKSAWALQFTKMTFIGVTTSKKGGEIRYVIPNGEIKNKTSFASEYSGNLNANGVIAILLPSNVKGMKQVKNFLEARSKDKSRVKDRSELSALELEVLKSSPAERKFTEQVIEAANSFKSGKFTLKDPVVDIMRTHYIMNLISKDAAVVHEMSGSYLGEEFLYVKGHRRIPTSQPKQDHHSYDWKLRYDHEFKDFQKYLNPTS